MNQTELPLGLGMALAQNEPTMHKFETLCTAEKEAFIVKSHTVKSKSEMKALVNSLIDSTGI